jgi:formylglycine-generating enzyme required for sulfatase activity
MRQNSKIYLAALLLVGAVSMMTVGAQAAKLAVLVVGLETDAASDAFATGIRYEFTQKGYEVVTKDNNAAVATKLAALRKDYKDGKTVDTIGLAAWGKDKGLDFVQLVVEKDCDITIGGSTVSGREQLSQVVSCSTAKYTDRGYYRTQFVPNFNQGTELEEMVFIAGGVFQMGCVSGRDSTCGSNETSHWVQVNNFYIGRYEVTQALWKKVMGDLPSNLKSSDYLGDDKPVLFVSWNDITGFLAELNSQTGKGYRLPTEAEWEYAARGCREGVCERYTYSGSNTVGDVAYYNDLLGGPTIVGTKSPNTLRLYDMSGNAYEWCSDVYDIYYGADSSALSNTTQTSPIINPTGSTNDSGHVIRGGGWYFSALDCRVSYRSNRGVGYNSRNIGFRLALP